MYKNNTEKTEYGKKEDIESSGYWSIEAPMYCD